MSVMTRTDSAVTRSGHPKLPALDVEGITATETAAVTRTLDSIDDPVKRLKRAVAIIAKAEADLADKEIVVAGGGKELVDGLESHMKKLALSLALHEGARNISAAIGMTRGGFYQMTVKVLGDWPERPKNWTPEVSERAKARRIWWKQNAKDELPEVAAQVFAAKVRRDVARAARDELVLDLVEDKKVLAAHEAADIIGRNASRISQLKRRDEDAEQQ
jgi:hypothetical protein